MIGAQREEKEGNEERSVERSSSSAFVMRIG